MSVSFEEKQEASKKLILLLLAGSEKPIRTRVHLQKELFLLTTSFPKLNELLDFKSSNYGVYSDAADAVLENNLGEVFEITSEGIIANEEGQKQTMNILDEMTEEKRERMMRTIRIIRSIYDRLSPSELEFLVYITYGYAGKSLIYEKMIKDKAKFAGQLLRKGAISQRRYRELLGETFETCA